MQLYSFVLRILRCSPQPSCGGLVDRTKHRSRDVQEQSQAIATPGSPVIDSTSTSLATRVLVATHHGVRCAFTSQVVFVDSKRVLKRAHGDMITFQVLDDTCAAAVLAK